MGASQPLRVRAAAKEVRKSMELVEHVGQLLRYKSKCQNEGIEIVDKALDSLAVALTLLCGKTVKEEGVESAGSQCSDIVGGDSGESGRGRGGKSVAATATKKGRARRRSQPYYRRISAIIGDGYTWRKYGQKEIQSSKYPKSYFRCSYKYSRKCSALKQVQRSEEDPSAYIITYIGHHTCQNAPSPAEMKPPPEAGEASPPPQSAITMVGDPEPESSDCRDTEDMNWSELDLQIVETGRSSVLSSSSMYGDADMEMFDTNGFLIFSGFECL